MKDVALSVTNVFVVVVVCRFCNVCIFLFLKDSDNPSPSPLNLFTSLLPLQRSQPRLKFRLLRLRSRQLLIRLLQLHLLIVDIDLLLVVADALPASHPRAKTVTEAKVAHPAEGGHAETAAVTVTAHGHYDGCAAVM